jgi:flagellar biosynthesis protein FlhF
MRLKVFHAASVADAMTEIRRTLGNDAVIVRTETAVDGVCVTAAVDATVPCPAIDGALSADIADTLYDRLDHHRVPAPIAEKLLGMALALGSGDPVLALGGALDAAYSFRPLPADGEPRRLLLVGSPGQGKTVTAARLAARAVLSRRPVQVIAADMDRAGAFAQITELCRPMGLKPRPWSPSAPLSADEGFVIVDGPGVDPFDPSERAAIEDIVAATGAEPVLVLAAGSTAEDAAETAAAFHALGARRMIVTRLAAARRLGGVLAAAESGLAIAEAGIGRTLAETLVAMTPLALARLLIGGPRAMNAAGGGGREKAA